MKRRKFVTVLTGSLPAFLALKTEAQVPSINKPIVISTWAPNVKANTAAWEVLSAGGKSLDAVHQGVMVPEADPNDQSVGYGGLPDRDGKVTLDACIMDHQYNIGSVMALEFIKHPISVARLVMEQTPHVQLVGDGALQFALANGFEKENLLTPQSEAAWKEWLKTSKYSPMTTVENQLQRIKNNHDTIGMLSLDSSGNLAGACTTSGMAYKMHGRVGDSPIIGAGLYVDNEVGAATATGVGEEIVRICGSYAVVEMMRQGHSPSDACRLVVERYIKIRGKEKAMQMQAGFIALSKTGEYGCFSVTKDFTMAVRSAQENKVVNSPYAV